MKKSPAPCPRCSSPLPPGYAPNRPCPRCLMGLGLDPAPGFDVDAAREAPARVASSDAPRTADLAASFPQLEFGELIGEGGMGFVYRARQRVLDRDVALKVLRPAGDDEHGFSERFLREAKALAKLSHPNIVAVYDFGQTNGYHYLVMELVHGTNLRALLERGPVPTSTALSIVREVSTALQFAHDAGIVHRDVKPENILVDADGRVKIVDFGLARVLRNEPAGLRLTHSHQAMGTPHYMAPEQFERPLEVDHRADLYSLGVVFYELLTGELPLGRFAAPSAKAGVDARLDEVVFRSLEKEPEKRYQHASDVTHELDTLDERPAPSGREEAHARPSRHQERRERRAQREEERGRRPPPARRWSTFWKIAVVVLLITCVPLACIAALLVPGTVQPEIQAETPPTTTQTE